MVKICSKNHMDLTGKRYGRLIVMGSVRSEDGRLMWQCQCDCGSLCVKAAGVLNAGLVSSCGCIRKSTGVKSGEKYGRLTALESTEKRSCRAVIWKCRCECGNVIETRSTLLKNGQATNCGCVKKVNDKENFTRTMNFVDDTCIEFLEKMDVPLKNSKSGVRGVFLLRDGRYKADLTFRKKRYYLGTFRELDDAVKARKEAEIMVEEYLEKYHADEEK